MSNFLGKIGLIRKSSFVFLPLLFSPILINLGQRSYIAQDEGFYALQAKWILDSGNWIAPLNWGDILYDRTIGAQWLIALSQSIFGRTILAAHIPSILCAIISVILTSKISNILIGKEYQLVTPCILSTTFLWVNYAHLATQDMPLLACELFGLFSLLKFDLHKNRFWLFAMGIWIGPAILLKSVMVLIPLLAITPYIFIYHRKVLVSRLLLSSILLGSIPFLLWISFSIYSYGLDSVSILINKIYYLSTIQQYSQPFYYYLYNIPANTFPWFIFAILGAFHSTATNSIKTNLILVIYPTIFIIILSTFSTKVPYYALQLVPLMAINASLGLQYFCHLCASRIFRGKVIIFLFGLLFVFLYAYTLLKPFDFTDHIHGTITLFTILLSFSITCFIFVLQSSKRELIISLLIGPYIAFSILTQSSLLTDRDPIFRRAISDQNIKSILNTKVIDFVIPSEVDGDSFSKLVKVSLHTSNHGVRISTPAKLQKNHFAWISSDSELKENGITIIARAPSFEPWLLVLSKS